MQSSRFGILLLVVLAVITTTNCAYFNKIVTRKNLVDGAEAYKGRKFAEAEELFRRAAARDPEGTTLEGRTAQLFLARTIHSRFIGDRRNTPLAEQAIEEYKKVLVVDPNEQSAYKAVAGLLENLQKNDQWEIWVKERSQNAQINNEYRAEALTSLAVKQYNCANEITDTDKTKKEGKRDGKDVFIYVKPENAADLEKLRACVTQGTALIDQAIALETDEVKNMKGLDLKAVSDADLVKNHELVKSFESTRSYRASLLIQASRLAEMDGKEPDAARLRSEAEAARTQFQELSEVSRNMQTEIDDRKAAAEAAEKEAANSNSAS